MSESRELRCILGSLHNEYRPQSDDQTIHREPFSIHDGKIQGTEVYEMWRQEVRPGQWQDVWYFRRTEFTQGENYLQPKSAEPDSSQIEPQTRFSV